jgi:peptidoglycan hydrolase-like protein with peptidoglycan-binding domain
MSRNVSGQAYALTVLTPIEHGREEALSAYLDALGDGDGSPLARVPGTHLARWVVIGQVKQQPGQRRKDALKAPRLLFTSNFDGPLDAYLEALRSGLAGDADAIWGNCTGYPGHQDAAGFPAWIRQHQIEAALFFGAYGEQTVSAVHTNLAARTGLIEFALETRGLDPAALHARFLERFPA